MTTSTKAKAALGLGLALMAGGCGSSSKEPVTVSAYAVTRYVNPQDGLSLLRDAIESLEEIRPLMPPTVVKSGTPIELLPKSLEKVIKDYESAQDESVKRTDIEQAIVNRNMVANIAVDFEVGKSYNLSVQIYTILRTVDTAFGHTEAADEDQRRIERANERMSLRDTEVK
jgi:hypothetical protein